MKKICAAVLLALCLAMPARADEHQDSDGHTSLRTREVDGAGRQLGVMGNPYATGISCALGGFATVNVTTTDQVVAAATPAGGVRHYLRLFYSVANIAASDAATPRIYFSFGAPALPTQSPYQLPVPWGDIVQFEWPSAGGFMPSDALHVIGSGPSQLIVETC